MRDYVVPTLRYKLIKRELLDVVIINKSEKPEINLQETDPSVQVKYEQSVCAQFVKFMLGQDNVQLVDAKFAAQKAKEEGKGAEESKVEEESFSEGDLSDANEEEDIELTEKKVEVFIPDNERDSFVMWRNHSIAAQPFKVGYGSRKVIDQGGGYRALLNDMMTEINDRQVVKLLSSPPCPSVGNEDQLVINQFAQDEDSMNLYKYMGALFAFSFLSEQPFGVDFSKAFWRQLLSYQLTKEDVQMIDTQKFNDLEQAYGEDSEDTSEQAEKKKQAYQIAINLYFSKYQR